MPVNELTTTLTDFLIETSISLREVENLVGCKSGDLVESLYKVLCTRLPKSLLLEIEINSFDFIEIAMLAQISTRSYNCLDLNTADITDCVNQLASWLDINEWITVINWRDSIQANKLSSEVFVGLDLRQTYWLSCHIIRLLTLVFKVQELRWLRRAQSAELSVVMRQCLNTMGCQMDALKNPSP